MIKVKYGAVDIGSQRTTGLRVAHGTFTLGTARTTVNIGFRARYLTVMAGSSSTAISTYNADISTTQARYSSGSTATTTYTMASNTSNSRLHEVTNTGFSVNKAGSSTKAYYYAIG